MRVRRESQKRENRAAKSGSLFIISILFLPLPPVQAHFREGSLLTQKRLPMIKKRKVNGIGIIDSMLDKILYDQIKLVAVG